MISVVVSLQRKYQINSERNSQLSAVYVCVYTQYQIPPVLSLMVHVNTKYLKMLQGKKKGLSLFLAKRCSIAHS